MNTIQLIGAEEVSRAAHAMVAAAHEMQQAATSMYAAYAEHHRWMDDWLLRLEDVLDRRFDATHHTS